MSASERINALKVSATVKAGVLGYLYARSEGVRLGLSDGTLSGAVRSWHGAWDWSPGNPFVSLWPLVVAWISRAVVKCAYEERGSCGGATCGRDRATRVSRLACTVGR